MKNQKEAAILRQYFRIPGADSLIVVESRTDSELVQIYIAFGPEDIGCPRRELFYVEYEKAVRSGLLGRLGFPITQEEYDHDTGKSVDIELVPGVLATIEQDEDMDLLVVFKRPASSKKTSTLNKNDSSDAELIKALGIPVNYSGFLNSIPEAKILASEVAR